MLNRPTSDEVKNYHWMNQSFYDRLKTKRHKYGIYLLKLMAFFKFWIDDGSNN